MVPKGKCYMDMCRVIKAFFVNLKQCPVMNLMHDITGNVVALWCWFFSGLPSLQVCGEDVDSQTESKNDDSEIRHKNNGIKPDMVHDVFCLDIWPEIKKWCGN